MVKGVFHMCTNQLKTPHDLTKKKKKKLMCFVVFSGFPILQVTLLCFKVCSLVLLSAYCGYVEST